MGRSDLQGTPWHYEYHNQWIEKNRNGTEKKCKWYYDGHCEFKASRCTGGKSCKWCDSRNPSTNNQHKKAIVGKKKKEKRNKKHCRWYNYGNCSKRNYERCIGVSGCMYYKYNHKADKTKEQKDKDKSSMHPAEDNGISIDFNKKSKQNPYTKSHKKPKYNKCDEETLKAYNSKHRKKISKEEVAWNKIERPKYERKK